MQIKKKKIPVFMLTALVAALLCTSFLSTTSLAKVYTVAAMHMEVAVQKNGDLAIEEHITYDFQDSFNGIFRNIDLDRSEDIIGLSVSVDDGGTERLFQKNNASSLDATGEPGTYHAIMSNGILQLKIFEKSDYENKTFIIRYNLTNVVEVYNDTAALNRKLIDTGWDIPLSNITARITFPEGAAKEDLRIFVHGPLEGSSEIVDGRTLTLTSPYSSPGSFIEALVLFPKTLVPDAKRILNNDALPGFLENEKRLADEANANREAAKADVAAQKQRAEEQNLLVMQARAKQLQREAVGKIVSGVSVFIWLFAMVLLYLKYDKERVPVFKGSYYRELPGEYTPAEVSFLMYGSAKTRDILATLMDLVRKKQIFLSSQDELKQGFFGSKTVTTHAFVYRADAVPIPLKSHESFLLSWFLTEIGDGSAVTLDQVKEYTKNRSDALEFKKNYDKWVKMVSDEAEKNQFDDKSIKNPVGIAALIGLLWFGVFLVLSIKLTGASTVLPTILGLVFTIYAATIKRRTPYGNEQYTLWKAFRKFLKDFSNMEAATLPSVIIWEHYLVYAISLGVAEDVIKQLPLVLRDEDLNNRNLTYMYGLHYGSLALFSNTFSETMRTVDAAISTATSVANSAASSSSGGGGGFSGGSSGGGGGGGGGGAF